MLRRVFFNNLKRIIVQPGMKRELEEMSAEMSGSKKTKMVISGKGSAELHDEQWTKVEKKKKKTRKAAESKLDVCSSFLSASNYLLMFYLQNSHPRFMYSNSEIVKRHHAITIDVSF